MKVNGYYIFIALLFISMLGISIRFFRGAGNSSVGVAYSRSYNINSERDAIVKHVAVVAGQQVKAGDLLIELNSFDLDLELDRFTTRINTLKSERAEKSKLANSEIAYVKAEQGVEIEKLNSAINQLEAELALNQKLTKEFSNNQDKETDNPIFKRIEALKLQRARIEEAIEIKIDDIQQEKETEITLLDNQVLLLERERSLLVSEKGNLRKIAAADGVIEKVLVKEGEQVSAFTSLLTVNPLRPTTVIGYLVGKKTAPPVGAEVMVRGQENGDLVVSGKVIGYGAVVSLPEILQKSTAVNAFGREFFIEISDKNNFANGERVLIR